MKLSKYEFAFIFIAIIAIIAMLTGCAYFELDSKTVIDYRYTGEYTTYESDSDGKTISTTHHNEKFELLWEYTYADGHTERRWEDCTRFEYQNARKDLGDIDENWRSSDD